MVGNDKIKTLAEFEVKKKSENVDDLCHQIKINGKLCASSELYGLSYVYQ